MMVTDSISGLVQNVLHIKFYFILIFSGVHYLWTIILDFWHTEKPSSTCKKRCMLKEHINVHFSNLDKISAV